MAKARRKSRAADMAYTGQLLVWTWRKFVTGHADCPLVAREFHEAAGDGAENLLLSVAAFLQVLGLGCRRTLALGHPQCTGLTPDEAQILEMMGAAQSGDEALFAAHLRWLVCGPHQAAAQRAVYALVEELENNGLELSLMARGAAPPSHAMLQVVRH